MRRVAVLLALLAGCGSSAGSGQGPSALRPDKPTPTHGNVINMPEGFSDVAFNCYKFDGIYVTYDDVQAASAVSVVSNDPNCKVPH